jgi:hypothetical protein
MDREALILAEGIDVGLAVAVAVPGRAVSPRLTMLTPPLLKRICRRFESVRQQNTTMLRVKVTQAVGFQSVVLPKGCHTLATANFLSVRLSLRLLNLNLNSGCKNYCTTNGPTRAGVVVTLKLGAESTLIRNSAGARCS